MTEDWLRLNRDNWDDRAVVHADSAFYDLPGFREGGSTLRAFELAEVGEVTGRELLHLQCHMGQDTLSWTRAGARTTGLDFSEQAIGTARTLAADTGLAERADFVVADVYGAGQALGGRRYDIVYTGLGALCWLPDLDRWAEVVTAHLKPGGFLYLAEFHPFSDILADDGRTVEYDYFDTAAQEYEVDATYTDGPKLARNRAVSWLHSMGSVLTALARAGLRLEFLHEHDWTVFGRFPVLEHEAGQYRLPKGQPAVPLMYSLKAVHDPR